MVAQLFLSLAQLALALVLGAIAAYLAVYLFQRFTRELDQWEALRQGNTAVGVVLAALVLAVAIVLRPALVVDWAAWDVGKAFFFRALAAQGLQLAVGLILAVLTLVSAFFLFAALTRGIDEVEELKKGNLAIAGLLAGVLVGVGLLVSQAVAQVMSLVSSALF
jgi:uncharacterized membrane protein YjfL (UPF0719 family)